MIILIESVDAVKKLFRHRQRILVDNRNVLGMNVMVVTVPIPEKPGQGQQRRLKRRVLALLMQLRCSAVYARTDFTYPEWFDGYSRISGEDIAREFLGNYAVKMAKCHDSVYVYMKSVDSKAFKAVAELSDSFRTVCVSLQYGSALQLAESIMRRCGASVIINPIEERIYSADAAVFFNEPIEMPILKPSCVCINADDVPLRIVLADGREMFVPDGYPQKALISEAVLHGCIRFEDIQTN